MSPYYDADGITIYHGDCADLFRELARVDHVITDPPYDRRTHDGARSAAKAGAADGKISRLPIDFAPLDVAAAVPRLLIMARRWCLCFCAMEMIATYQQIAGDAWVRAGFWRRPDAAPQFTGDRPGQPGEAIAIMHRPGSKTWNGGGHHAFWEFGVERTDRVHPAQKPEPLMLALIAAFTNPGDLILDPYMGSGTTLVAAKRIGRRAIGIELDERYCAIAASRLRQAVLNFDPPADDDPQADLWGV